MNSSAVTSAGSGPATGLGSSTASGLTAMFRTSSGLRKKRHGSMLRNSSMSSVSLDDLASFSDTPANFRTTSNTPQLSSGSASAVAAAVPGSGRPVSIGSQFSEPPESSSLSRRARAAKSAVLSLTIEHSRLMAMLASVESMVHSASSNSSARTSAQFTSPQPHFPDPLPQSVQPSEPTRVQQLAAMYERQDQRACGRL